MRWMQVAGRMAAAALLVVGLAGSARSAVPLWEDFEKGAGEKAEAVAKRTPWGNGWRAEVGGTVGAGQGEYLRYPARGVFSAAQGTVEIEVLRDNVAEEMEAFFTLQNADAETILAVQMYWDRADDGRPTLEIATPERLWYTIVETKGFGSHYSSEFPLPRIGRGGKAHIVFTWGRSEGECTLWVNGRQIEAMVGDPASFSEVISQAKWISIGAQPRDNGAATSQSRSVISKFYVYDQVLDGRQLSRVPEEFRPSSEKAPAVTAVSHNAGQVAGFSGKLVAGDVITVTLEGAAGAAGSFDVVHFPDVSGAIELDWQGWGVYLEDKPFLEQGEVDLREVQGYEVYVANEAFDPHAAGLTPVASLETQEQSYKLEMLTVDTPYYVAVTARMRDGSRRLVLAPQANLPLVESAPGVYTGSYKTKWKDRYARAAVIGRLSAGALATVVVAAPGFAIDPGLTLALTSSPAELMADEKSTSQISLTLSNANGKPVPGHRVRFLLATTSQYTGMVGGGAFTEQVGGRIAEEQWGETDLFGRVSATYVAGFAAKTAIIVARDMISNSTGAAYVKTFIQATAGLELEPVQVAAAELGYRIDVSSSDEWLTADGRSQARVTARVTLGGKPVEGHRVRFAVSPGSGTIKAVRDTTDGDGEARAVYTAGRKIGVAVITATDTTVDISGSVSIELRSDAPAKIAVTVDPGRLPADGRSQAEVQVLVTDINDNPNENTEVEYRITEGDGRLREERGTTDRRGASAVEYEAGSTPGRVSFEITVRSAAPTEEELGAARALALAVTDYDFF